jgi:hypothetical protein
MKRLRSRRLVLLLPLALLAAALAADAAWGQARPGFQPGGPRPGGPPNPGGVPGPRPSGIPGIPGAGGNPRPPGFVPPFVPPGPRPNVPQFERVWSCSNCGAELGRGGGTPALATCPFCNARFVNGTQPMAPGGRGPAPAAGPQMVPAGPAVGVQGGAFAAPAAAVAPGWKEKPVLQSAVFLATVGVGVAVWGGMVVLGTVLAVAGRSRRDVAPADGH